MKTNKNNFFAVLALVVFTLVLTIPSSAQAESHYYGSSTYYPAWSAPVNDAYASYPYYYSYYSPYTQSGYTYPSSYYSSGYSDYYLNPYTNYNTYTYAYSYPYAASYGYTWSTSSYDDAPTVSLDSVTNIDGDKATFRGEVDMNDFDNGIVFFVYGQDEDAVDDVERDYDTYRDVNDDEQSDDFEVLRVDRDLDGNDSYRETVDGLDEGNDYFVILCVEYDDGDEQLVCSSTESFEADGSNSDVPDVTTYAATDINTHDAELRGKVVMNDFDSGRVFFVYGESESRVEDAQDEDRYLDIDESGDYLQKVVVDSDLDGSDSYQETVYSLDNNTDIFFRICVEYQDDGDYQLECGSVRDFTTD